MDEIIKAVAEAEERAQELKNQALEKAAQIVDGAREQASAIEKQAAADRQTYRENTIAQAISAAQCDYDRAIERSKKQAADYAKQASADSDVMAGKIVRRISGGNC